MKKWRGSLGVKFAVWVLITVCAIAFVGSCLLILMLHELNIYDYFSEETFRQEVYEEAATQYSVIALEQYLGETQKEAENAGKRYSGLNPAKIELNDTSFRYGIIKADNIDNVDYNSGRTYVKTNFTGHVDEETLFAVSYEVNDSTVFSASNTLLGGYSVYSEPMTLSVPVYNVCYNADNGIFFYEAEENEVFYPARYIDIWFDAGDSKKIWSYEFDFEKGMYHRLGAPAYDTETTASAEKIDLVADSTAAVDLADAEANGILYDDYMTVRREIGAMLSQEYVNFASLDGMLDGDYYFVSHVRFCLDGIDYQVGDKRILYVYEEYLLAGSANILELPYYWVEDHDGLKLNYEDNSANDTYWIVSQPPEEVAFGWSGDLFMQANMMVTFAYGLRYGVYVILFVSLGLGLFLFVWLIAAAGHRVGTDAIVPTWLDTIPFDLFLIFAAAAEWGPALLIVMIGVRVENEPVRIVLPVFLILCMCWVLLYTILNFAVRVKLGAWWRNTIVWKLGHLLVSFLRMIAQNLSFLWKVIVAWLLLSAVEFSVVARGGFGPITRFWLLERVVLTPLLLIAVIQMQRLKEGGAKMAEGNLDYQVQTEKMFWEFRRHGENLNSISVGMQKAVAESVKSERFRTELITNVSHDIKTPLTSIINYVDLLGKEELENETAVEYLEVLTRQSNRLKKLIEDLMEASKASTGNLAVNFERLEAGVSMTQTVGEFEEKLQANQLELLVQKPEEPVYIMADARHLWRVMDNLMNNICKYAQPGTRVYVDLKKQGDQAEITFRNTSKYALNISADELMERFVRGDSSRNTEGSGLGLSIARSLMELMNGTFSIHVDGDLFKVVLELPFFS